MKINYQYAGQLNEGLPRHKPKQRDHSAPKIFGKLWPTPFDLAYSNQSFYVPNVDTREVGPNFYRV